MSHEQYTKIARMRLSELASAPLELLQAFFVLKPHYANAHFMQLIIAGRAKG